MEHVGINRSILEHCDANKSPMSTMLKINLRSRMEREVTITLIK